MPQAKVREAKTAYVGNLLMDNREGLAVGAAASVAMPRGLRPGKPVCFHTVAAGNV